MRAGQLSADVGYEARLSSAPWSDDPYHGLVAQNPRKSTCLDLTAAEESVEGHVVHGELGEVVTGLEDGPVRRRLDQPRGHRGRAGR